MMLIEIADIQITIPIDGIEVPTIFESFPCTQFGDNAHIRMHHQRRTVALAGRKRKGTYVVEWENDGGNGHTLFLQPDEENVRAIMHINHDASQCVAEWYSDTPAYSPTLFGPFLEQAFRLRLVELGGLVMHAATIGWQNSAILFTAKSGTGKSTHARFWIEHAGAYMLDGDHPALRWKEERLLAYGTPWPGDPPLFRNTSEPVRAIVEIVRSTENRIVELTRREALLALIPRSFIPYHEEAKQQKGLDVLKRIIESVPVYRLYCKPEKEAMEIAKACLERV